MGLIAGDAYFSLARNIYIWGLKEQQRFHLQLVNIADCHRRPQAIFLTAIYYKEEWSEQWL